MNSLMIIDTVDTSTVVETLNKIATFQMIVQKTLKSGHDYDVIPGTNKPTLLKPGAEKINLLFGVNAEYEFLAREEDYKGDFFAYTIKCTLFRNGQPVSQGVGSCNSREKKYRYVTVSQQDLPSHIDPSNAESVTDRYGRTKYRIDNPDVCSLANTILKMAKKRAHVDATLQLAALSEIFTQDVEDMKDLIQNEQTSNMTTDEAANLKVNIGKHKGKKLGEVYKEDQSWINWFLENGKDEVLKKAITILVEAAKEHKQKKVEPKQDPKSSEPEKTDFEKDIEDPYEGTPFAK